MFLIYVLPAVVRQQKFLTAKFGGVEDEMHDDDEEDEEDQNLVWGGRKQQYYDADNRDFEVRACSLSSKCLSACLYPSLHIYIYLCISVCLPTSIHVFFNYKFTADHFPVMLVLSPFKFNRMCITGFLCAYINKI